MKNFLFKTSLCAIAMVALSSRNAAAQIDIYSNVGSFDGKAFYLGSGNNGASIGNQITLNDPGSSLTFFDFLYYVPGTLPSNVGVDVRFSYNDGPAFNGHPTPGTTFFDSGWTYNTSGTMASGGYGYMTYTNTALASGALDGWSPSLSVPANFTFSITWTNLTTANEVWMPLANNTPGISSGNYWYENNGPWQLLTNTVTGPGNIVVDFEVPEPSFFALGMTSIGGALLFGSKKLRRKL